MKNFPGDPRLFKSFTDSRGPIWSLEEYFNVVYDIFEDVLAQHNVELHGVSMVLKKARLDYGQTLATKDYVTLQNNPDFEDFDRNGYAGNMFFRTSQKVPRDIQMDELGRTAMLHLGSGGYDTSFKNYWGEVQKDAYSYNQVAPPNLQYRVYVYKYNCHFYTADFPKLGSMDMLAKLDDTEIDRWSHTSETDKCRALDMQYAISGNRGLGKTLETLYQTNGKQIYV